MKVELADGDFYVVDMQALTTESGDLFAGAAVILDGVHGWHNTYRLINVATDHGMRLSDDEARATTRFRQGDANEDLDSVHELATRAESFLNDQVSTEGWSFGWSDGHFLLANDTWWEGEA